MTKEWVRVFIADWKPHWCPAELLEALAAEGKARFHEFIEAEPATEGGIDLPGMVMATRSYQEFNLDGFRLTIPTTDCEYYHRELSTGRVRQPIAGGPQYVKLHGWLNCVVLTLAQRDHLLARIDSQLPYLKKVAAKEDAALTAGIKSINKGGTKVVSHRDPDSLKGHVKKSMVSKPNREKN